MAFLSSIDAMPSASDFAALSDIGGFQDDVELEVPPQGQIPELSGESSTQAWSEEAGK